MSNVVNLPTYTQVENVKTAVENMETVIVNNSGVKWGDYTPVILTGLITVPNDNDAHILYEVTGKGYVDLCAAVFTAAPSTMISMEVLINGSLVVNAVVGNNTSASGFGVIEHILNNAETKLMIQHIREGFKTVSLAYSTDENTSSVFVPLYAPLFFDGNIKILLKHTAGSSASTQVSYDIRGGVAL